MAFGKNLLASRRFDGKGTRVLRSPGYADDDDAANGAAANAQAHKPPPKR